MGSKWKCLKDIYTSKTFTSRWMQDMGKWLENGIQHICFMMHRYIPLQMRCFCNANVSWKRCEASHLTQYAICVVTNYSTIFFCECGNTHSSRRAIPHPFVHRPHNCFHMIWLTFCLIRDGTLKHRWEVSLALNIFPWTSLGVTISPFDRTHVFPTTSFAQYFN